MGAVSRLPARGLAAEAGRAAILVGVALSSGAVLVFEVALTRLLAVAQFYHFAFLVVGLALLGFGASGSALHAFPGLGAGGARRCATLALGQSIATIGAYLIVNAIPFDSFSIAWDRGQVARLVLDYVVLAVPFFLGGMVIGALLTGADRPSGMPASTVYGVSLAGSGVGALVTPLAIGWFDGEGVVAFAAALAAAAVLAFEVGGRVRSLLRLGAAVIVFVSLLVLGVAGPAFMEVRLSPYKGLSATLRYPGSEIVSTSWDAAARVDHVRSEGIRSLPGLSLTYTGTVPPQDGLTFDGDDLSPVPRLAASAEVAPSLLTSLPFLLRPTGEALVLEPRGGLDVAVALGVGTGHVVAVEPSGAAVAAAGTVSGGPYDDPRVLVVVDDPRSFVARTDRRFQVVDLALTAPYRPVTSGAYSLAEEYLLTVEAFDRYLAVLEPGGVLAAMRWTQIPPSEETRLLALAAEAVRRHGLSPEATVAALRGYSTMLVMVAPDGFSEPDLETIRAFAETRRFDLVALPGLLPGESNRFNVLPSDDYHTLATALLTTDRPDEVYAAAGFDITPPRDDHPFFGHFFRWSQAGDVLAGLGHSWQPFGGAGFFVLVASLVLSTVGAAVLIIAPLGVARIRRLGGGGSTRGWRAWTLGYFGVLGLAFLFVEIPLIEHYILVIGHPTTAVATVLFALLSASGLGSLLSDRLPWRPTAAVLVGIIVAYPFLLRPLTGVLLGAPLGVRFVVGALALAPPGFLMGTLFPKGLAHLDRVAPGLKAWAWGVNGTASVISAAAASLLALSYGFSVVLALGAACYAAAGLLARGTEPGTASTAAVTPRG